MVAPGMILSGRYLLADEVGTGSTGTVYRATNLRLQTEVAVRVVHLPLARDQGYVRRLLSEAQLARAVSSPRLAAVIDAGEHAGIPYVVTEFVPGQTLAGAVEHAGVMSPARALRAAIDVARALDDLAQHGLTHGALRPHNIKLHGDGVKVLDIGLARASGRFGGIGGKLSQVNRAYAPPERESGVGDIRSDIYSLGVLLHWMIVGDLPFEGGGALIGPRRVRPAGDRIPGAVYPVIVRCLAGRPEDRYPTPQVLVVALRQALHSFNQQLDAARPARFDAVPSPADRAGPTPEHAQENGAGEEYIAPPPSSRVAPTLRMTVPGQAAKEPAAERPAVEKRPIEQVITSAASVPVASAPVQEIAGPPDMPPSIGGGGPRASSPDQSGRITSSAEPAAGTPASAEASSRKGRSPALALAAGAVALAVAGVVTALLARGDASEPRVESPVATVEVAASAAPAMPAQPTGPSLGFVSPAAGAQVLSPVRVQVKVDGATLRAPAEGDASARHLHYFVNTDPALVLRPGQPVPTGSQEIIHTAATSMLLDLKPGPNAVWVVTTDNDHLPLMPAVQAEVRFTVTGVARSAEEAPLVFQSVEVGQWRLALMDGTGRNRRTIPTGDWDDGEPAWSPDASKIAFVSNRDGRFHLYLINAGGSGVQQLTRGAADDRAPAWSPDGQTIAFTSNREGGRDQIFVLPATGGEPRRLTGGVDAGSQPSWSADGGRIVFVRGQGGAPHLFVVDAGGGEPRQLTTGARRHAEPAWSPDGAQIAFAALQDGRWEIFVMNADGSGERRLTDGGDNRRPAWSPDGRQLAFASGPDGRQQLRAISLEGGQSRPLTSGQTAGLHPSWPRR